MECARNPCTYTIRNLAMIRSGNRVPNTPDGCHAHGQIKRLVLGHTSVTRTLGAEVVSSESPCRHTADVICRAGGVSRNGPRGGEIEVLLGVTRLKPLMILADEGRRSPLVQPFAEVNACMLRAVPATCTGRLQHQGACRVPLTYPSDHPRGSCLSNFRFPEWAIA